MKQRPASITVIGWIFIAVGLASLVAGAWGLYKSQAPGSPHEIHDFAFVAITAVMAAAGGVLALRGSGWGRGLMTAWILLHVVVAAHHEFKSLIVHGLLFTLALWILFRPSASAYFRSR